MGNLLIEPANDTWNEKVMPVEWALNTHKVHNFTFISVQLRTW